MGGRVWSAYWELVGPELLLSGVTAAKKWRLTRCRYMIPKNKRLEEYALLPSGYRPRKEQQTAIRQQDSL
jgi:hypothetical protein